MNEYSTPPYILYAVPAFLALIGIELLVTRIIKKDYYRLNDSINDLTLGTYSRVIGAFYAGAFFLLYVWLYENARMFDLTAGGLYTLAAIPVWIGGFLAVDMLYYWFHRTSHQVAVVWGSHEPHHSSEEYNLAVALRQGSFQGIFSYWFYLPLAFIGLHPVIFLTCSQFNTIYQFWIHTRAIDKMWAPIEWIFNTPSHHRVHHGINPKYIDKNHAGTLIIWDKLFGTFQAEEEEAVYGTVKPLASWNPVWANVQYWIGLAKKTAKTPGALNKLKVWFAKPGWQPAEMGGMRPIPEVDPATFVKYDPRIPGGSGTYVFFHFVLTIPIFVVYALLVGANVFSVAGIGGGLFILFTLFNIGMIMEGRSYMFGLELFRNLLMGVGGLWLGYINGMALTLGLPLLVLGLGSAIWFTRYWKNASDAGDVAAAPMAA